MSSRRLVDVIVLGGRVGPLAAACLLARRGYKVLHIEHEGLVGSYRDNGLSLPLEPDLVPGPRSSPAIANVLQALALTTQAQRSLRPVAPALQILAPGHRFDLANEGVKRARELGRELGKEDAEIAGRALDELLAGDEAADPLLAAMPPMPPSGLMEQFALRKIVHRNPAPKRAPPLPTTQPLAGALEGLSRFSSYLWSKDPSALHLTRSRARMLRDGPHRLNDGPKLHANGYADLLRKRLIELGGVSLAEGRAVAEEVTIERGKVVGLKVLGDATDYRCRFLVSGIGSGALHRILPIEGRKRRFDSNLDRVRPRETLFSLNLVMDRRGLPVGFGEAAIHLADPSLPPTEENLMLLETFAPLAESGPVANQVVLQASCFIPVGRSELGNGYLEEIREKIIDVLRSDLLPFLDRHLVLASSPVLTRRGPSRGARLSPHPLLESDLALSLGVGLLPPRTPYKNLVLTGREVLPGLGTEGEFLAAHRATEVVAYFARKHDPLKGQ